MITEILLNSSVWQFFLLNVTIEKSCTKAPRHFHWILQRLHKGVNKSIKMNYQLLILDLNFYISCYYQLVQKVYNGFINDLEPFIQIPITCTKILKYRYYDSNLSSKYFSTNSLAFPKIDTFQFATVLQPGNILDSQHSPSLGRTGTWLNLT